MKLNKRIAAVSAAALLATLALGGAASAADNQNGAAKDGSSHSHTIEAPTGTPHVAAKKIEPASKDNRYSQTIEAPAGTRHTGAGHLADK
ncbi:hypothetical protein OHA37_06265 [Streptomyces sp. NBC_00335]|uniref:hypothetical protein n=1 Tax=unclassified Streptomyces TaxID=2593676 RepID=UPI00224FC3B3|nr:MULTISPECIES: hypothetical protein [unclassified Streptomyces]MCX5403484.1 hypothetical protein [Streptomyces sp. NBC_00086]